MGTGIGRIARALPWLEVLRQVHIVLRVIAEGVGQTLEQRGLIVDVVSGGDKRGSDPRGQEGRQKTQQVLVALVYDDALGRDASQQQAVDDFQQQSWAGGSLGIPTGIDLDDDHVARLEQLAPTRDVARLAGQRRNSGADHELDRSRLLDHVDARAGMLDSHDPCWK